MKLKALLEHKEVQALTFSILYSGSLVETFDAELGIYPRVALSVSSTLDR